MLAAAAGRVIVARIGAAHGVRGEVRVKAFTADPADIGAYGPLATPDGSTLTVETIRQASGRSPDMMIVQFLGINTRDQAEALNGVELSVAKDRLPPPETDEFYHLDLIGLEVVATDGARIGTVIAVPNYGAGDLLEVAPDEGETLLIPFTAAAVPEVDLRAGRVMVAPMNEIDTAPDGSET
ncbi:ribosome maturation factor RimM [Bauldia sp.]|uniref:ribosome maturation factor RimM n=1 Tax=Bauldia sp. TaxID=2575872 RepID=UPI003BAAD675